MVFKIFLAVMFVIGFGVEANPMERCMAMVKFNEQFESIINLAGEEQLNIFCVNMTSFLNCVNDAAKELTGMNLRDLVEVYRGTHAGSSLTVLLNLQELVEDICTEGTELHDAYLAHADCYRNMPENSIASDCKEQAADAYSTFRDLQAETGGRGTPYDEPCVVAAYQLGCLGADVKKQCGDEAFEAYKKMIKKIGFFKSGVCSSEILDTLKNEFLDRLEMAEEEKNLYRMILNLKRRRR